MSHHHEENCHCHDHDHKHDHEHCDCHDHEHCDCHDHDHKHDHDHCDCHSHDHHHDHHDACHCHEHSADGCCEHCEAALHGENTVSRLTVWRICIAAVLYVALFFLPVLGYWRLLAYFVPYLLIGYDVLWDAAKNVARGKLFDEQFLMAVATLGAFAIGEYPEGVAVMLFYQLGELLQTLAVGKSRRSIAALMDIRPDVAVVLRDGQEQRVSPEEVEPSETVIVRAGERIPLDGIVLQGETTVDNAALTGESLPQPRGVGDTVHSGGVNLSGTIYIKVENRYHDSTVSKILSLAENASEKKARVENFITRFSRYYTPVVVGLALALAFLPTLLFAQPLAEWVHRALVFLVVSCPCALVISVPLSFFGGIGGASRHGILIKGAGYLEQLALVDTVVLDKTGTLTKGSFSVAEIIAEPAMQQELLRLAAALEQYSNHPIARGICAAYTGELPTVSEQRELAGKGVTGIVDDKHCAVGNAALLAELGVQPPMPSLDGTAVYVACDGAYLGYLILRDEPKANAAASIAALKREGVTRTVMLTGDSHEIAARVGEAVGIDCVHASLLPQDKVQHVEALLGEGRVAFVGDGINDAPVLARADVGVAMGGIGSDAAIESADVVLMDDDLAKLPTAIRFARKTMRIVRENIAFALGVKAVILVLGALGIANMWIAVFGDVGVMLLAILNAMRAMRLDRR